MSVVLPYPPPHTPPPRRPRLPHTLATHSRARSKPTKSRRRRAPRALHRRHEIVPTREPAGGRERISPSKSCGEWDPGRGRCRPPTKRGFDGARVPGGRNVRHVPLRGLRQRRAGLARIRAYPLRARWLRAHGVHSAEEKFAQVVQASDASLERYLDLVDTGAQGVSPGVDPAVPASWHCRTAPAGGTGLTAPARRNCRWSVRRSHAIECTPAGTLVLRRRPGTRRGQSGAPRALLDGRVLFLGGKAACPGPSAWSTRCRMCCWCFYPESDESGPQPHRAAHGRPAGKATLQRRARDRHEAWGRPAGSATRRSSLRRPRTALFCPHEPVSSPWRAVFAPARCAWPNRAPGRGT
jgi:hypothetical protein